MQKRSPRPKTPNARDNNRVRIVGGTWRRRVIEFPDLPDLRPTPDRVRETLFNWLGQSLVDKRCLDLFAGSGALGFEAASRGACSVTMVEIDHLAITALRRNQDRLGASQCRIVARDALDTLAVLNEKYDIIFVDPPFSTKLMTAILPKLSKNLLPGGLVYAEWREPLQSSIEKLPGNTWKVLRSGQAGAAFFALLSMQEISPTSPEAAA